MAQTSELVRMQVEGMKSDVFELGLFRAANVEDRRDAEMLPREWDADTLAPVYRLACVSKTCVAATSTSEKRQGEHHLSLVDDLSKSAIDRMRTEGSSQPAAIIETSPRNFQAWLNHGERLSRDVGTAVARALANRFDGDANAADWRHFGRLAGFTNQKEKHRQTNGLFPFVRLIESTGTVYREAGNFVATVREQCEHEQDARRTRDAALARVATNRRADKSIEVFRQESRVWRRWNPRRPGVCTVRARSRRQRFEEVSATIRSRDLSHKGAERRREEYVERTVRKALALQQSQSRGR